MRGWVSNSAARFVRRRLTAIWLICMISMGPQSPLSSPSSCLELKCLIVYRGPNWIHGVSGNPIMSIAQATESVALDPEGKMIMLSPEGHLIDEEIASKIREFVSESVAEAFQYSNQQKENISAKTSVLSFFQEKLDDTDFSDAEKQLCLELLRFEGAGIGESIESQSLKFFSLEEHPDQDDYFVASTYQRILEHIAEAAKSHADIRFKEAVVSVHAAERGGNQDHTHQVTVRTSTGTSYTFDELVITCPLGWLKQNPGVFHPPLPGPLLQSIHNVSYGRLEKIYVKFPQAFWHINPNNPDASPVIQEQPVFAQFLSPTYAEHPVDIVWSQECLSLASLPAPHAQPTLLFYTWGPCGTEIVNRIAHLMPLSRKYNEVLLSFLRPFFSRLPGYKPGSPECTPSSILATKWQLDPYAGNGSYCNFQVGIEEADRDIKMLRSGDGIGQKRGIWFAGEHTAPFVGLGTTTGAYWSGERAGREICEWLSLSQVDSNELRDDSLPSARQ
ncbi:unnamed protein product [Penicillium olsonii]|nr:unnamed protein product [Penicillium olsonii]